jgi:hypothetical protein
MANEPKKVLKKHWQWIFENERGKCLQNGLT